MQVTVNGETHELRDGASIADLLVRWNLEPRRVAVEVNAELVSRKSFADTALVAGDQVEIVTLVGGG